MATTVTAVPSKTISFGVQAGGTEAQMLVRVAQTLDVTSAAITGLIDAIEAASDGKVCHISVVESYLPAGNKTASNNSGKFAQAKQQGADLAFENSANCKERATVRLPAPKEQDFTGVDQVIWSEPNTTNDALIAAIEAVMKDRDGTGTFDFDQGWRVQAAIAKPNVG